MDENEQFGSEANTAQRESDEQARRERAEKIAWCRQEWERAVAIEGTLAERYFTEHRYLRAPWPSSLRYSATFRLTPKSQPKPAVVAAVSNTENEIVALHAIYLDPQTGRKNPDNRGRAKLSYGPVSEGSVFLRSPAQARALVIAEGVETGLTRWLVGPADVHICAGGVRKIKPASHHTRVEVIADVDKVKKARQLAREYDGQDRKAYTVTVPTFLGDTADLNDLLLQQGESAVKQAVEEAERIRATQRDPSDYHLSVGSDVEIAHKALEILEDVYGPVIVAEGQIWAFAHTHFVPLDSARLRRLVHRADGAFYPLQSGKFGIVKLNRSRSESIIDTILQYRHDPDYFKSPPLGINCENGFIALQRDLDGEVNAKLEPHARRHRQRHIIKGRWPCQKSPEEIETSNFMRYLNDTFRPEDESQKAKEDSQARRKLCSEIAGAVAANYGTRVRSPKAVIFFSDEGATGKSTFLELMRGLANPEAVCSVPMSKFSDERYTVLLVGKVLNACDEISERAIKSDVFKRAITGEPLPGRDVYRSAISIIPVALHLFSTNTLPAFSGGIDGGVLRRLLPVTFPQQVPKDQRNPDLAETIREHEADLLLEFAVHGAEELLKQLDYTVPLSSAELLKEWANESDPVRGWAEERLEVTEGINEISCSRLYENFRMWCEARGIRREFIIKQASFGRRLLSACPRLERYRRDTTWFRNARLRNT